MKKLNFIPGIILILIFSIPAYFISKAVEWVLLKISSYISFLSFDGLINDLITSVFEKFIISGVFGFLNSSIMLLFPIILMEKYYKKFKINWLPGIVLVSIFFVYVSWTMIFENILIFIGFTLGWLLVVVGVYKTKTTNSPAH